MKTVYRTYKFRMYPNSEQRQVLARYFGSVRFIYNHYLAERKNQYEETGKSDGYAKQAKDLVALKRTEGFDWLKEKAGTVDYTGGGSVRPTSVGSRLRSQKPKSIFSFWVVH